MKRKFFAANLQTPGRLIRGIGGIALVVTGVLLFSKSVLAAVILIISGGFMLFEAVRGWCVMRACGIKTKY